MIGWLEGQHLESWEQGKRSGILLACSGIGFEIQLLDHHQKAITPKSLVSLWVHLVQREDGSSLFGFSNQNERNLFRLLIGVTGIGPQVALALLDEFREGELREAICNCDIKKLSRAKGIGKRTAERLSLELKEPLSLWKFENSELISKYEDFQNGNSYARKELEKSLTELGYQNHEINLALEQIKSELRNEEFSADYGNHLLEICLRWLSKKCP